MAPKAKEAPKAKAAPKAADGKAKAKPKKVKEEVNPEDKIPRVEQPNRAEMEEAVKKVNTGVEDLQKKLADLTKRIQGRSTGKEEFFTKKQALRAQLDEIQATIDGFAGKKDELYKQIEGEKQANKEAKEQLNKMKNSLGFKSVEEIDKRIADIEFNMWTSSLSLKEEKKYLDEIKELKRSKPKVDKVKNMEADVQGKVASAGNVEAVREQTKQIANDIKEAKEQKRAISAEYAKLNEERQKQMSDMPELFEERTKLQNLIQEKIGKRNEIRDEFRVKEKEYNAYLGEIRKVRAERAAESRAERQAEWDERRKQRAVEQLDEQPHTFEITLLEQTIAWCHTTLPKTEDKAKEDEKKATAFNNPDGSMVLLKKDDREEEFYYAPTKKKGGKKSGAGKKDDAGGKAKTIKHDVTTFQLFDKLKLDAPLNTDEIPPLLEKLESQLAEYNEKVKVWAANREEMKKKILEGSAEEPETKKKEDKEEEDEKKEDKEEETED